MMKEAVTRDPILQYLHVGVVVALGLFAGCGKAPDAPALSRGNPNYPAGGIAPGGGNAKPVYFWVYESDPSPDGKHAVVTVERHEYIDIARLWVLDIEQRKAKRVAVLDDSKLHSILHLGNWIDNRHFCFVRKFDEQRRKIFVADVEGNLVQGFDIPIMDSRIMRLDGCVISPDQNYLAVCASIRLAENDRQVVWVWERTNPRHLVTLPKGPVARTGPDWVLGTGFFVRPSSGKAHPVLLSVMKGSGQRGKGERTAHWLLNPEEGSLQRVTPPIGWIDGIINVPAGGCAYGSRIARGFAGKRKSRVEFLDPDTLKVTNTASIPGRLIYCAWTFNEEWLFCRTMDGMFLLSATGKLRKLTRPEETRRGYGAACSRGGVVIYTHTHIYMLKEDRGKFEQIAVIFPLHGVPHVPR